MKDTGKLIGGFVAGALLGSVAGLLLAPSSGDVTRKEIAKRSKKIKDEASATLQEAAEEFKKNYNEKLEALAAHSRDSINAIKEKIKLNSLKKETV